MDFDKWLDEPIKEPHTVGDGTLEDSPMGADGVARSDLERMAAIAEGLVAEYEDIYSPEWEQSPMGWIRRVPSAHKRGKVGEALVQGWARSECLAVSQRSNRGHDCVIEGLKVEVKTSLRWNNGRLVFMGVRDFDYDAVALLGLAPEDVGLWIVPKQLLWDRTYEQRRGAGGAGSRWFAFPAGDPPGWLEPWGGSLDSARKAIVKVLQYGAVREQEIAQCESWLEASSGIEWPWEPEEYEGGLPGEEG
jgi:hypothetical protein